MSILCTFTIVVQFVGDTTTPMFEANHISETESERIRNKVKTQVTIELLPSLNKELYTEKGRKQFLDWLFVVVCLGFRLKIHVLE